jgi:hypothetical protein
VWFSLIQLIAQKIRHITDRLHQISPGSGTCRLSAPWFDSISGQSIQMLDLIPPDRPDLSTGMYP